MTGNGGSARTKDATRAATGAAAREKAEPPVAPATPLLFDTWGPPVPATEQTASSWREQVLTRAAELKTLSIWLTRNAESRGTRSTPPDLQAQQELDAAIKGHLLTAVDAASTREGWRVRRSGADVHRAMSNLDAAEADLLRRTPLPVLRGQLPSLYGEVRRHLPVGDPRRVRMQKLADEVKHQDLDEHGKESVIAAVRAAASEARREQAQVRSFQNVILATSFVLFLICILVAVLGWFAPAALDVCFRPEEALIVCPTNEASLTAEQMTSAEQIDDVVGRTVERTDLLLLQLVGLIAGSVTGAAALRRVQGTSTPFSLPVALAVLKLPIGALTAVLGLLLMRGGFVPGLSALDSSAQIIAWAVLFGAAQQLFTGLVDRQAHVVLDRVGGKAGDAGS